MTWHNTMDNDDVLKLSATFHVGLLPSFSDTYGFSLLEMQAAGLPVISTDIRAFPEINNEDCGWVIQLSPEALKFKDGEGYAVTIVQRNLEGIIKNILEGEYDLADKSAKSRARIKESHCPARYSEALHTLYLESL